ncbi:hypothetical protein BDQ17DRAFT_1330619 [Cyathus striatus]|nr:hypothetical protein BDQ17DRAFT_1330619 [Cyathus striatus]
MADPNRNSSRQGQEYLTSETRRMRRNSTDVPGVAYKARILEGCENATINTSEINNSALSDYHHDVADLLKDGHITPEQSIKLINFYKQVEHNAISSASAVVMNNTIGSLINAPKGILNMTTPVGEVASNESSFQQDTAVSTAVQIFRSDIDRQCQPLHLTMKNFTTTMTASAVVSSNSKQNHINAGRIINSTTHLMAEEVGVGITQSRADRTTPSVRSSWR